MFGRWLSFCKIHVCCSFVLCASHESNGFVAQRPSTTRVKLLDSCLQHAPSTGILSTKISIKFLMNDSTFNKLI